MKHFQCKELPIHNQFSQNNNLKILAIVRYIDIYRPVQNKPDPWFCLQNHPFLMHRCARQAGGPHICPVQKAPCKFDKDIFNSIATMLILRKE